MRNKGIITILVGIGVLFISIFFSSGYHPKLNLIGNISIMEVVLAKGEYVSRWNLEDAMDAVDREIRGSMKIAPRGHYEGRIAVPLKYALSLSVVLILIGTGIVLVSKKEEPRASRTAPPDEPQAKNELPPAQGEKPYGTTTPSLFESTEESSSKPSKKENLTGKGHSDGQSTKPLRVSPNGKKPSSKIANLPTDSTPITLSIGALIINLGYVITLSRNLPEFIGYSIGYCGGAAAICYIIAKITARNNPTAFRLHFGWLFFIFSLVILFGNIYIRGQT